VRSRYLLKKLRGISYQKTVTYIYMVLTASNIKFIIVFTKDLYSFFLLYFKTSLGISLSCMIIQMQCNYLFKIGLKYMSISRYCSFGIFSLLILLYLVI